MKHLSSLVILLWCWTTYAQLPTDGLIAFYKFENNAIDNSGKNNSGQIQGGVTICEDRFGNPCGAMRFNGADGYITIPNSASLKSPVSSISITGWFKIEKAPNASGDINIGLLSKGGGKQNESIQYRFLLTRAFGDSRSTFSLAGQQSANDENYSAHPVEFGKWYFTAVIFEDWELKVLINNQLIAQAAINKPLVANDLNLEIGRDATSGKYFNGCLDDLRIYNRGLTPSEVTDLFKDESQKALSGVFSVKLPDNIERNTDAGKCSAVISFAEPVVSSACEKSELKQLKGLPSGSVFAVGKNILMYEAVSSSGKRTVDSFSITVLDKEPPSFQCPKDISIKSASMSGTTHVDYPKPVATDNCPNLNIELIAGPASGEFPEGENAVRYKAIDASGNTGECSFKVNVIRKPPPKLHCHGDIIVYSPAGADNVIVAYEDPYLDDEGNKIAMKRISGLSSGLPFRTGETEIRYVPLDSAVNVTCSFKVVVKDTIHPFIICPNDITKTIEAGEKSLKVVYDLPKATDAGSPLLVKMLSGLPSGSDFVIGNTVMRFETEDESGNKSGCSFKVTVNEKPKQPEVPKPAELKREGKKEPEVKRTVPEKPNVKAEAEKVFAPPLTEAVKKEPEQKQVAPPAESEEQKIKPTQKPYVPESERAEAKEKTKEPEKIISPPVVEQPVKKQAAEKQAPAPAEPEEQKITAPAKPFVPTLLKGEAEQVMAKAEKPFFADTASYKPRPVESKPVDTAQLKQAMAPPQPVKYEEPPAAEPVPWAEKPLPTETKKTDVTAKPVSIKCSENITRRAEEGKCGAVVNYKLPEVLEKSGRAQQTHGLKSGDFFKVGTTSNTFTAKGAKGIINECSFQVIIKDEQPPIFKCPLDTVIHLPANRRGIVFFYHDPPVADNCRVDSAKLEVGPKNGCFLQVGVHPFVYKAVDASGNEQRCTYSVTIKDDKTPVVIEPPAKIDEQLSLGTDSVHYEYKAQVKGCVVTAFIYDDGEEDFDTVSIIFNGQVIVNHEMIRIPQHGMIRRLLALDGGNENYLIAKAWNTGKYGLNTLRIDAYEGDVESGKNLKTRKPSFSKVLHSRPGTAGGMIVRCSE